MSRAAASSYCGERRVGDEVHVPGVDEQLARQSRARELAGGVDVTLAEKRVGVHAVHLDRDALGPRPDAESPGTGTQDPKSTAPVVPGRVCARRWAGVTQSEMPA